MLFGNEDTPVDLEICTKLKFGRSLTRNFKEQLHNGMGSNAFRPMQTTHEIYDGSSYKASNNLANYKF